MLKEHEQSQQQVEPTASTLGEAQPENTVLFSFLMLVNALEFWVTCLHEAGHAVQGTRDGGILESACVFQDAQTNGERGFVLWDDKRGSLRSYVAGYLAEKRWGLGWTPMEQPVCEIRGDFKTFRSMLFENMSTRNGALPSRRLRKIALGSWREFESELSKLWDRDQSYRRQIRSVACVLSVRGKLTGDEVRTVMAKA